MISTDSTFGLLLDLSNLSVTADLPDLCNESENCAAD